jgi:dynein heavy chain
VGVCLFSEFFCFNSSIKPASAKANKFSLKQVYDQFKVSQMRFSMNYDFEYVDLSQQIAMTPLTERCFLNLTVALGSLKAGCLVGPGNVGKQQTVSQLANQCGQHLQTINCDEFLTSRIATWYVKGLASSGSWVLFNKIERLAPAVLSSMAYQLEYLRNAVISIMDVPGSDELELNLNETDRVCLTDRFKRMK